MITSGSIANISKALVSAQKDMGGAVKDAANPFFKSKYSDLASVVEVCKEPLNKNGVVILQPIVKDAAGALQLETLLLHESGEWIASHTPIVVAKTNDPQAVGSAISYARRYGLQSLLSIPAVDDDGEAAMVRSSAATTTPVASVSKAAPKANGGFKPAAGMF